MTDLESQEIILICQAVTEGLEVLKEMREDIRKELQLRKDDGK